MIETIKLKAGSVPGAAALEFAPTPLTVFVGPNNSGKSRILAEIQSWSGPQPPNAHDLVLDTVDFSLFTADEMRAEIDALKVRPSVGENVSDQEAILSAINPQSATPFRFNIHVPSLINEAVTGALQRYSFGQFLLASTLRLDGTNRLNLLSQQAAGDLQQPPANLLAKIFADNDTRERLRNLIFDALERYIVIDPTNVGYLRMRLSSRAPASEREEKGWEAESVAFHSQAVDVTATSDGIRAFVGILAVMLAGQPKIALIDEPEAFLHPALAQKLGNALARTLRGTRKRLFASTHSANFLMGCIQAGVPLNIVRLTYAGAAATARLLPQEKISQLMRHPLLRSTGVLSGLFYEAVVVTEADSDRAFYQEVNERLLAAGDARGIPNCLFLNAQNKQTIWEIVKPLREMGIPAAGIVDIDVLKDGGQVWSKPLQGAFLPELLHDALHTQRRAIHQALVDTGRNFKIEGGLALLGQDDRAGADMLFRQVADFGMFIVPGGEAESWLKHLGAGRHGSEWLIDIFGRMGDNPDDEGYARPTNGDVWDFWGRVKAWIANPARLGIPA